MTWAAKMNGVNTPKSINGRSNVNVSKVNGMRGFIPTDIGANLKLWLDPSSEAYSNGASVPTATDRSGGGLNYTQATALSQPTFQSSGINGRKAYAFNGAQMLSGPAGALALAQNIGSATVMCVCLAQNATSTVYGVSSGTAVTSTRITLGFMTGALTAARARRLDADTIVILNNAATSAGTATLLGGVFNYTGNAASSYVNGVAGTTGTYSSGAGSTSNTASLASGLGAMGATPATGTPYTGSAGDVVFVQGTLSAANFVYLTKYLLSKYGIGGYN